MLSNSHRFRVFMCTGEYPDTCGQGPKKSKISSKGVYTRGARSWLAQRRLVYGPRQFFKGTWALIRRNLVSE